MIVWISGARGVGKTTLATALADELPGAVVADLKPISRAIREALRGHPCARQDHQSCPPWDATSVAFLAGLHAYIRGPVIVPMTVVDQDLLAALLTVLSESADVHHLVLHADPTVLQERIVSARTPGEDSIDAAEVRAARLRHLDSGCRSAEGGLHSDGHIIDTSTLTQKQVLTSALAYLVGRQATTCAACEDGRVPR
ncbi:AAA family ATPase [Streptomyces sp. SAI-090]|jgi:predicted kinase|uniref:AAA family ATPase n=1 Tax=Streptomyces sp. SAI-090 TaxID=2940545 RepID=UPI00247393ED|nr:AAA family ATPase [Streptomyces sp. SAI-090]MDH6522348.1 putative kinase [Streptomyces sp. SAI-090]